MPKGATCLALEIPPKQENLQNQEAVSRGRKRRGVQLLGVAFTFVLLAVGACSKDTKTNAASSGQSSSQNVPKGGDLVIGAEQEPDCMDWIDQCAGNAWGYWMWAQTMPRAFDVVRNGNLLLPAKRPAEGCSRSS